MRITKEVNKERIQPQTRERAASHPPFHTLLQPLPTPPLFSPSLPVSPFPFTHRYPTRLCIASVQKRYSSIFSLFPPPLFPLQSTLFPLLIHSSLVFIFYIMSPSAANSFLHSLLCPLSSSLHPSSPFSFFFSYPSTFPFHPTYPVSIHILHSLFYLSFFSTPSTLLFFLPFPLFILVILCLFISSPSSTFAFLRSFHSLPLSSFPPSLHPSHLHILCLLISLHHIFSIFINPV